MRRNWPWVVVATVIAFVLIAVSCGVGTLLAAAIASGGKTGFGISDAVAVIDVRGVIQSGESSGGIFDSAGAYSGTIRSYLKRAQQDPSVKAVILRIDSPGGDVGATEEIYDEILRTQRDYNKKVIISMGSMAASAGYYISAPADKIVAYKTSITGSIGVISIIPNVEGLLDMVGVKVIIFKSGPHKDESSGLRPITEDEAAIQQAIIDEAYNQFVDVIVEGREMDRETVLKLADGRIYTGSQAKRNGLVDELGSMEDAIRIAAELAELKGKPRLIEYRQRGLLSSLSATLTGPAPQYSVKRLLGIENLSGLQYLYIPEIKDK